MKNLKSSTTPKIAFKADRISGEGSVESLFFMRDAFGRAFLSDPFFKPCQNWIQIKPETLIEKKI